MRGGLAGLLLRASIANGCGAIAGDSEAPWPAVGETAVLLDIARTAFQVTGAVGTLEMPPGGQGGPRRRGEAAALSARLAHWPCRVARERLQRRQLVASGYAAGMELFRVPNVSAALDRKLASARETYTALRREAANVRAEILETAILRLIAVEVVLPLIRH